MAHIGKTTKKPGKTGPRWVTKAQLARIRGVARSSAGKACKGQLLEATKGDLVDLQHPLVKAWVAGERSPGPVQVNDSSDEIATLGRRKRKAEVNLIETRVERERGALVPRDHVAQFVFGAIQTCSLRMLKDIPARLQSRYGAEVGGAARDLISTELALQKRALHEGLASARVVRGLPPATHAAPTNPERERDRGAHDMAMAAKARIDDQAAAKIVELVAKSLARACDSDAGELFERVVAAVQPAIADMTSTTASIIRSHIDEAARAATEITKDQNADTDTILA